MILLMRSLIFSAFLFLIFSKRPFKKKIFKFSCDENCCFSAFSPENFSSEAENVFFKLSCHKGYNCALLSRDALAT